MRDQRNVRRRHRVVAELVGADPGEGLAFARRDRTLPAPADVERHQEMESFVGVARKGQRRQTWLGDGDAELLVELADQALLRPLAGLELAARKLPEAGQRLAFGALRDQNALVGVYKRAGHHQCELEIGHGDYDL